MFDYKTKELNKIFEDDNIIVENVIITENYDMSLKLSNGYSIEIFNNAENDEYGEAWRFFESGSDKPHFVVGRCIKLE